MAFRFGYGESASTAEEGVGGGFAGFLADERLADAAYLGFQDLNAVLELGKGQEGQILADDDLGLLHGADIIEVHGSTPTFAATLTSPILSSPGVPEQPVPEKEGHGGHDWHRNH